MARPVKEKYHLYEKRQELIWALNSQGYNNPEIGVIFNIDQSRISRIIKSKPRGWKTKWTKVEK